jgi:glycosyltransferase involved in cell wall biosynthesis
MMSVETGHSVWPWVEPLHRLSSAPVDGQNWPKISIVTPNFNYGHLVETTIRSILAQEYPNLEYIVIDDGSTDDSVQVIGKHKGQLAHFEHQANQGQYATINKGFARATGEIFGWINSDDIYLPWTLRAVGAIFRQFPEIDWITGVPASIQDGVVHYVKALKPFPQEMIRCGVFHGGEGGAGFIQQESCFWRRSLWEKAGSLRTTLKYAADFELWTRFAKHAELYAVSTLLGGFTNRGGENRSIANRERYMTEVNLVLGELRADRTSAEAKLSRNLSPLFNGNGSFGRRSLARRLSSVKRQKGPILKWDFGQSCYRITRRSFF